MTLVKGLEGTYVAARVPKHQLSVILLLSHLADCTRS